MAKELYVVCVVGDDGEPVGFATGGGSSSMSYIRARDNEGSAKRSLAQMKLRPHHKHQKLEVRKFVLEADK